MKTVKKTATAKAVSEVSNATMEHHGDYIDLKNAGYEFAGVAAKGRDIAAFVLSIDSGFVDEVKPETKAGLGEGFMLRFHENHGEDVFTKGDTGAVLFIGNTAKARVHGGKVVPRLTDIPAGAVCYGVHHAFALTPQQFGMLKNSDPGQHEILGAIRKKYQKYESNTIKDLQGYARDVVAEANGQPARTRTMVTFLESIGKVFDKWDKQVKNAENRADDTASPVRYRMAREAFFKIYNAK